MELLDGFAFECGANTMIIDMERSKRYTKNLFLATYREAGRYDEGVKLWKTKYQYEFEHGIHVGVDIRGPEFDIYTCEHTRKFYNQMRKDLYKNIKKSLTKQLGNTPEVSAHSYTSKHHINEDLKKTTKTLQNKG